MLNETSQEGLRAALEHLKITATFDTRDGVDWLAVTHQQGPRELADQFDLGALTRTLDDADAETRRDLTAAFARGVYQVLTDLPLPAGRFVDLAGRLVPRIERPTFAMAMVSAARQVPWSVPVTSELAAVYFVELPDGNHMVTDADLSDWGVTVDRITSAARSLLYHKTQAGEAEVISSETPTEVFRLRDGYDAARLLALDDLFYHRARKGMLVALPDPDLLMFVDWRGGDDALARFSAEARAAWSRSAQPLSAEVFTLVDGKIRPASA